MTSHYYRAPADTQSQRTLYQMPNRLGYQSADGTLQMVQERGARHHPGTGRWVLQQAGRPMDDAPFRFDIAERHCLTLRSGFAPVHA